MLGDFPEVVLPLHFLPLHFLEVAHGWWLSGGPKFIISTKAAGDLSLIKFEGAYGVESGVIELFAAEWAPAPVTALFGLLDGQSQMAFNECLERVFLLAASSGGKHSIVDR